MAADIPFLLKNELENGEAVYQDLTNEIYNDFGYDIKTISVEEAAKNLIKIFRENDFTFFEYFQTDRAGHKCKP